MGTGPYRWSVLTSVAWRVVAELYRRHASERPLRITHFHPGLSGRGTLRLQEGWHFKSDEPHIDLILGGGGHGTVAVQPWRPVADPATARWPDANVVRAFLAAPDPKTVVDDIEQAAGLPRRTALPPSSPDVLAVRVLAEVLERHAFSQTMLRASCGFHDASIGAFVTAWARAAPTFVSAFRTQGTDLEGQAEVANRVWALHPALPHEGPAGNELPRGAVILDLIAAEAWSAETPERRLSLVAAYEQHARRIDALAHEVERLMR